MSWVRPDQEILPDLLHAPANAQLYDAGMLVVSQKPGRNCTVATEFWTWDLWWVNPLRYPLANSYFSTYIYLLIKGVISDYMLFSTFVP